MKRSLDADELTEQNALEGANLTSQGEDGKNTVEVKSTSYLATNPTLRAPTKANFQYAEEKSTFRDKKHSVSCAEDPMLQRVLKVAQNAIYQSERKKSPVSFSTVANWKSDLEKHLKGSSAIPAVTKQDLNKDIEELLKTPHSKLTLREALKFEGTKEQRPEDIALLQFDPNFMSEDVICRHPLCKKKNQRAPSLDKGVKRDLYLCPHHRGELKSLICQAIEEKKLPQTFSKDEFNPDSSRFEGYTSLISLLEAAYQEGREKPNTKSTLMRSQIVEEATLNVRNFLIITHTLLNPEDDNLAIALPPVVQLYKLLLNCPENSRKLLKTLISSLKEVVDIILFSFGILYTWILFENPGTYIGAGVGGIAGAVCFVMGPAAGAAGVAVGGALGGFLGKGIYDWGSMRSEQNRIAKAREKWTTTGEGDIPKEPQPLYNIEGNEWGHLMMYVTCCRAWRKASN